jgi:hypothetical protein
MELGDPGYRELWFFADLRGGNEYASARLTDDHRLVETSVHGLVVARQSGVFLLVELDANGDVIDDWVELDVDEAKSHAASMAGAEETGLEWEPVPDSDDVRAYIRRRLGT